jgi:hypothetical protein
MHGENLANGAKPGCSVEAENALDRENANEEQFPMPVRKLRMVARSNLLSVAWFAR